MNPRGLKGFELHSLQRVSRRLVREHLMGDGRRTVQLPDASYSPIDHPRHFLRIVGRAIFPQPPFRLAGRKPRRISPIFLWSLYAQDLAKISLNRQLFPAKPSPSAAHVARE